MTSREARAFGNSSETILALPQVWALLLSFLVFSIVAQAQDVFSGGDATQTSSDQFSTSCIQGQPPNIWKQLGVNPLTCHPESAPQDSNKQCSLQGMTVVAHQGETCYYCAPMNPPAALNIPMDQVENASKQGYLCGESPVDPNCMAVCTVEFSTTTKYVPPTPQVVVPPLQNGQATSDPCHPYYNLSTAAGQAAMQANAARDAAACNASRCQHNPELTVCTTTTTTTTDGGPPGSKGVTLVPLSHPVKPPPSKTKLAAPTNLPQFDRAMSACLAAKVPYLPQPTGPAPAWAPAQLPSEAQIFKEETAMALQAQAAHDAKYNGNEYNAAEAQDYMVGWLDHCLLNAGLQQDYTNNSPDDPRVQYAQYLGVPLTDRRVSLFSNGYSENTLPPLPLMAPYTPSANP